MESSQQDCGYGTESSTADSSENEDNVDPVPHNDGEDHLITDEQYNHLLEELELSLPQLLLEPDLDEVRQERMMRNLKWMAAISPTLANTLLNSKTYKTNHNHTVEDTAAICIQRCFRGYLGRKIYVSMLYQQFQMEEEIRRQKQIDQLEEAQLLIENHQLETEIEEFKVAEKNRQRRFIYYITVIQRAWRKYWKRKILAANVENIG